jgi:hypothetical protein
MRRVMARWATLFLLTAVLPACDPAPSRSTSPAPITGQPPAAASVSRAPIVRVDPVLGVSFESPADLGYLPATRTENTTFVLTEKARLSSEASRTFDVTRDFLVELSLVPRDTDDLHDFAARKISSGGAGGSDVTVAGSPAYRMEGAFQNGERIIVLVSIRPGQVLMVQAYPRHSPRIGDLEMILGSLRVRP